MIKVRLPVLVKDPEVAKWKDVKPVESFVLDSEDFFLDGPVTRRVAVLDFNPKTGTLTRGARFIPPIGEKGEGEFALPKGNDFYDSTFMRVATFGGVYKTIRMFEEPDTLGRRVHWAFPGPQLLVVPRAGEWANAFYERNSRSIQLFFFTPPGAREPVYTCHSQDIIAHETAHAVIDCVAPDLYDSTSPEGLAIHESIADLATLMMAFRSRELAGRILEQTNGSIEHSTAFTEVAEQFGGALRKNRPLRDLKNDRKMTDRDLDRGEPHALSEVLSGALYTVMVQIYNELLNASEEQEVPATKMAVAAEYQQWALSADPSALQFKGGNRKKASPGRALFIASERFKRTVLRALDYLPPGEVSFADFGRALLASDQASHPDSEDQREWLRQEFVRRGIVATAGELEIKTNYANPAVSQLDLDELVRSDWLAYQFANENRMLLGIPADVPFDVRPRLDVTKKYYHQGDEPQFTRECLFKVSWSEVEPNEVGGGLPAKRRIAHGSTLAIDWKSKTVRAVVQGGTDKSLSASRDAFLKHLLANDAIRIGDQANGPGGKALRGVVSGEVIQDVLRVRASARALHAIEEH
jgi:hypothetical protein